MKKVLLAAIVGSFVASLDVAHCMQADPSSVESVAASPVWSYSDFTTKLESLGKNVAHGDIYDYMTIDCLYREYLYSKSKEVFLSELEESVKLRSVIVSTPKTVVTPCQKTPETPVAFFDIYDYPAGE